MKRRPIDDQWHEESSAVLKVSSLLQLILTLFFLSSFVSYSVSLWQAMASGSGLLLVTHEVQVALDWCDDEHQFLSETSCRHKSARDIVEDIS